MRRFFPPFLKKEALLLALLLLTVLQKVFPQIPVKEIEIDRPSFNKGVAEEKSRVLAGEDCLEVVDISGNERLYIYRCSGDFVMSEDFDDVEVLLVAGGGGGGFGESAGGGGAGEMVYKVSLSLTPGQTYPVKVGLGGDGAVGDSEAGANGEDSSFAGIVALGGGGGGSSSSDGNTQRGKSGGSGGGGAAYQGSHGQGGANSNGRGNAGGIGSHSGNSNNRAGGGGGGAGSAGTVGNAGGGGAGNNPGIGGGGAGSSILEGVAGISVNNMFAAGGGGTARKNNGDKKSGAGGSGIGGNGNAFGEGGAGSVNTGSGGGAGSTKGGKGASGIVIIKESLKVLPVYWNEMEVSFLAADRSVAVKWSTSKEGSVSHFEVERSEGGINDFKKIAVIQAGGWSEQIVEYGYKDSQIPFLGGKLYYRIKQVDFSGQEAYSKVYAVNVPKGDQVIGKAGRVWRFYPNPSSGDNVNLDLVSPGNYSGEAISFRFVSSVISTDFVVANDLSGLGDSIQGEFLTLANGFYVLEVCWGNKVEYIKVIKR